MEFGPYQQNDSAEFLALLMDRIETGLKSNPLHATKGREQMAVLTHTMKGETVKMMNYECADYGNHTKRRFGEEVVIPLKVTGGVKTLERQKSTQSQRLWMVTISVNVMSAGSKWKKRAWKKN